MLASPKKQEVTGEGSIGRYWLILSLLTVLAFISCAALAENWLLGIVGVAILMPGIQLVCSLVTAIWVKVQGERNADTRSNLWAIGKITLWSIAGAIFGGLVMISLFRK